MTGDCVLWLDLSILSHSYHTPFCPRDLGPKSQRNDHQNLPYEANALLDIFLKWIYRIPFYEDSDGRAQVRCAHSLHLQSSVTSERETNWYPPLTIENENFLLGT